MSKSNSLVTAKFIEHQRLAMRTSIFANGATGWVPQEELVVIAVSQEGRIGEGFIQAARIASIRSKLRTTLCAGLTYPALLLFGGGLVVAILPGYALAIMTEIIDVNNWPTSSRSVLAFSNFISRWGLLIATSFLILLAISVWAAPRWSGSLRRKLDWYPPFVLYRQFTGPEILSAWLALMQTGVQRIRALSQLESRLPMYLAEHIRMMRSNLYRGETVESALNTGLFSTETLDDLRVYERVSDFGSYSERIADADINRAITKLESNTKMLSSILLIAIGAMAVWIYIGIARVAFVVQVANF